MVRPEWVSDMHRQHSGEQHSYSQWVRQVHRPSLFAIQSPWMLCPTNQLWSFAPTYRATNKFECARYSHKSSIRTLHLRRKSHWIRGINRQFFVALPWKILILLKASKKSTVSRNIYRLKILPSGLFGVFKMIILVFSLNAPFSSSSSKTKSAEDIRPSFHSPD